MKGREMQYQSKAYQDLDREKISNQIRKQGFNPILISDPPGYYYPPHDHPETKLLAFLNGSMEVTVEGKTIYCKPGDQMIIPGNTTHTATAGPDGCTFYWSEKLIV